MPGVTGEIRKKFRPPDGAVHVRFVSGNEGLSPIPVVVARSGLTTRFAVIQDSFVEGCVDTYFDEALWRALVELVTGFGDQVTVLPRYRQTEEAPLGAFLAAFDQTDLADREPPWALLVRSGGEIALAMVTEYWAQIGGPALYHDSYTYSLFSAGDMGGSVMSALAGAPAASRWRLAPEVVRIPPERARASPVAPGWVSRVLSHLRRR